MREVSGPLKKANTPNSSLGRFQATHRNWEDDFGIAGQVSNVAVQGHPLLNGPRLAEGQGHAQNGVRTEFSCNGTAQLRDFALAAFLLLAWPHPTPEHTPDCIWSLPPPDRIYSPCLTQKRKSTRWGLTAFSP